MKFRYYSIAVLFAFIADQSIAQKPFYTTSGGELMFSSADVKINGASANSIIRFSPVFNFQSQAHKDFNDKVGFFTGLGIRNVGFIYDDPFNANTRYKIRTYTVGVPVALKFGNMNGTYIFVGYEIEFPINYKEKKFVNEEKVNKFDSWFSDRTPAIYNTLFAGIQLPEGAQLKFKYYATNFYNKDYQAADANGQLYKPYADFNASMFYVSLSFQILKGTKFYYSK